MNVASSPTFSVDKSDSAPSYLARDVQTPPRGAVRVMGLRISAVTEEEAVATIIESAVAKRGQWTITANLDHLRRYHREPLAQRLLESADTVVADGAPLIWASRIAGTPLPERVAGADMVWSISDAATRSGIPILLLGGNTGVGERAAIVLRERFPDIKICGTLCPPYGFDTDESQLALVEQLAKKASPGIVLVALGFPKQDVLIERLRAVLPCASLVGIGISLSFIAGDIRRSPAWTRRLGLEWCHRMVQEPRRLVRRYLVRGIPFAISLLGSAAWYRIRSDAYAATDGIGWGRETAA
jgi:N-acetylglucosaminyldiphosphoundecaprenol N-acetyl-beta-D-mannosaminyltransferase